MAASIEKETEGLERFKEEFEGLTKVLGSSMGMVKKELDELRGCEKMKQDLDVKMAEQQHKFMASMKQANDDIASEQKKYKELLESIKQESLIIDREKSDTASLEQQESLLKKKLEELSQMVQEVHEKVNKQDKHVELTKDHLKQLKQLSESIKEELEGKKEMVERLAKQSKDQEQAMLELQQKVVEKLAKSKKGLKEEAVKASEKVDRFFSRKNEIDALLKDIENDKHLLKNELQEVVKKAIAFNLSSKNEDVKKHVSELQKKMTEVEAKRGFLRKEFAKLSNLLK